LIDRARHRALVVLDRGLACRGPNITDSIYSGAHPSWIRHIDCDLFIDHAGQAPRGYIDYFWPRNYFDYARHIAHLLAAQLLQLRPLPRQPVTFIFVADASNFKSSTMDYFAGHINNDLVHFGVSGFIIHGYQ
jgi:hypothetical protein